jgi:hypothetical protein
MALSGTRDLGGSDDPTFQRLEDQITWYDKRSGGNQRWYKRLKIAEIIAAALIAGTAGLGLSRYVTVALAVLLLVFEGLQQVNQYHANWISYRSTSEALKHEKFLYLGKSGPYAEDEGRHTLLAERIESTVSQEHAKWVSAHEQEPKRPQPKAGAG